MSFIFPFEKNLHIPLARTDIIILCSLIDRIDLHYFIVPRRSTQRRVTTVILSARRRTLQQHRGYKI